MGFSNLDCLIYTCRPKEQKPDQTGQVALLRYLLGLALKRFTLVRVIQFLHIFTPLPTQLMRTHVDRTAAVADFRIFAIQLRAFENLIKSIGV